MDDEKRNTLVHLPGAIGAMAIWPFLSRGCDVRVSRVCSSVHYEEGPRGYGPRRIETETRVYCYEPATGNRKRIL